MTRPLQILALIGISTVWSLSAQSQNLPTSDHDIRMNPKKTIRLNEEEVVSNRDWAFMWHWLNNPAHHEYKAEMVKRFKKYTYTDSLGGEPKFKRPFIEGPNEKHPLDKPDHFITRDLLNVNQLAPFFNAGKELYCKDPDNLGQEYCKKGANRREIWEKKMDEHLTRDIEEGELGTHETLRLANHALVMHNYLECEEIRSDMVGEFRSLQRLKGQLVYLGDYLKKQRYSDDRLEKKRIRTVLRINLVEPLDDLSNQHPANSKNSANLNEPADSGDPANSNGHPNQIRSQAGLELPPHPPRAHEIPHPQGTDHHASSAAERASGDSTSSEQKSKESEDSTKTGGKEKGRNETNEVKDDLKNEAKDANRNEAKNGAKNNAKAGAPEESKNADSKLSIAAKKNVDADDTTKTNLDSNKRKGLDKSDIEASGSGSGSGSSITAPKKRLEFFERLSKMTWTDREKYLQDKSTNIYAYYESLSDEQIENLIFEEDLFYKKNFSVAKEEVESLLSGRRTNRPSAESVKHLALVLAISNPKLPHDTPTIDKFVRPTSADLREIAQWAKVLAEQLEATPDKAKGAEDLVEAGATLKRRITSLEQARRAYEKSILSRRNVEKEKAAFMSEYYKLKGIREAADRNK